MSSTGFEASAALVRYDTACRALAEAKSVDEAKEIRDRAVAMAAYARQAKNRDLEADAVEIRLRATRRLDELVKAQAATVGLHEGGRPKTGLPDNPVSKPTLASQGIDKNLANQARVLGRMSDSEFEETVADARDTVTRVVRRTIRTIEIKQRRASYSLETPPALLPAPTGRKLRMARHAGDRQWMLVVGPGISRADLLGRIQEAQANETVQELQQERDELLNDAAELEARAKALRDDASFLEQQIKGELKEIVGDVSPFVETYTFQAADEATDAELAALTDQECADRLVAARGTPNGPLAEIDRGYWGDMSFLGYAQIPPGPGSWTGMGSPDWLQQLFPDWDGEARELEATS